MKSTLHKILVALISLVTLSIFLLPFCSIFFVGDVGEGSWNLMYLVEDWVSLLFYLPFVALWSIYLVRMRVLSSRPFKILLGLTALLTFIVSFLSAYLPGQDYEPYYGVLSSLLIFPFVMVFLINYNALTKARRNAS
jgi:hypothetical protein